MKPPYFSDDLVALHHGDCLDVLREMPDNSVDAVVTDPPYALNFMGKGWDSFPIRKRGQGGTGIQSEHAGGVEFKASIENGHGFQQWCEAWATECLRILKPGGHLLAFGGTRTWHRLACAVEDAGFEMRESIAWLYGSGFPKSLDVSKAIDKRRDEDRAPVDAVRAWLNARRLEVGFSHDDVNTHLGHASNGGGRSSAWMTNPTSRELPTWHQWQILKVLLCFGDEMDAEVWRLNGRKGKPGDNFEAREKVGKKTAGMGTGQTFGMLQSEGSNGEAGKVVDITAPATDDARTWQGWGTALKPAFEPIVVGRKPLSGTVAANVLAHGTGALNIDGCRVGSGDDRTSGGAQGSAPQPMSWGEATGRERPTGGRWPANVVLDESHAAELDRQSGASRFFPTFRYEAKAPTIERPRDGEVAHPTVKPLDLMRWLVRLVTPPGGLVLDPFAGSGTTAEACVVEGFRCITIEREADYLPLIVARLSKPIQPDMFGGAA